VQVAAGRAERGILVCSTGIGMSIAANKVAGIRAALGTSPGEVELVRSHNDANILTLGAKYLDQPAAESLVETFLTTEFTGGRHSRRLAKIAAYELAPAAVSEPRP
jgi:ribose 5-phosphate isomerase B